MLKNLIIIPLLLINMIFVKSQKFNSKIDKDSLFSKVLSSVPTEKIDEIKRAYEEGSDMDKDFLLFMLSMPTSSKEDLIRNFEQKNSEIINLKSEYKKIIPNNYIVEIEFNPENKIFNQPESIDLKIFIKKTIKKKFKQK